MHGRIRGYSIIKNLANSALQKHYAKGSSERRYLIEAITKLKGQLPLEVPLYVNGKPVCNPHPALHKKNFVLLYFLVKFKSCNANKREYRYLSPPMIEPYNLSIIPPTTPRKSLVARRRATLTPQTPSQQLSLRNRNGKLYRSPSVRLST